MRAQIEARKRLAGKLGETGERRRGAGDGMEVKVALDSAHPPPEAVWPSRFD